MDRLILLSVLLAQNVIAAASTPARIDTLVAFGGHVAASSLTELQVRVVSSDGGALEFETSGGSPDVRGTTQVMPGAPVVIRMPIGIDLSESAPVLRTRLNRGAEQTTRLEVVKHPVPWYAIVASPATRSLLSIPGTEAVSPESLPHLSSAYGQVTALAIDSRALAALEDEQLRALLEFVGVCGRLLLIDVSASVERIFVNRAACEGRHLRFAGDVAHPDAAFAELIRQATTEAPTGDQLIQLLRGSQGPAQELRAPILFWVGYMLILVLLILQARTRFAALGFIVVGTLLATTVWPNTTRTTYVAWAEASSQDRVARYVGLERHSASRRGTLTLPGDSFGVHPAMLSSDDLILLASQDEKLELAWQAAPFGHINKFTEGSFDVDSGLKVLAAGDHASVCNTRPGNSAPAFLQWRGGVFAIPALAPSATWSTVDHAGLNRDALRAPELQLFLARSAGHAASLLLPLPLSVEAEYARAWLLRHGSTRPGAFSCQA